MVFLRVFRFLLALYLFAAVLYTTECFLLSPFRSGLSFLVSRRAPRLALWSTSSFNSLLPKRSSQDPYSVSDSAALLEGSSDVIHWPSSAYALQNGLGHEKPVAMSEDLFLSKAFAGAMRPSKIVPFFYRATGGFDKEDITITTLVTSNRFQVFAGLVERYPGEVGAAC
jgi:glycosyltransferase-like protein LARGE